MQATYKFSVRTQSPAGPDSERQEITVDVDTTDPDHAYELAARFWPDHRPANCIDSTLAVFVE